MKRAVKVLAGTGVVAGLSLSFPVHSLANILNTNPISINPNQTEAYFNHVDKVRRTWYESDVKKLDKKAGNRLYKVSDNGLTYWTPLRPTSVQNKVMRGSYVGGVGTGEHLFENKTRAFDYDNGQGNSAWLKHLWQGNPKINRNFKVVKFNIAKQSQTLTKDNLSKIGDGVIRSDEYNYSGNFKGRYGTWRFLGYTYIGTPIQNPFFPPDYVWTSAKSTKWTPYKGVSTNLFRTTLYDTARYRNVKRRMIERLLAQNPDMRFKTVDQWMDILSLQTDPEVNPKTGRADGSYGGAIFAAYTNGGRNYRTITLLGDTKKQGDLNMNLERLVVTEAEKDANGNYPIVLEVKRKKAGEREYAFAKAYDKVIPGKRYRIVSTVRNESKLVSTKHEPTTVLAAYAKNYDTKSEAFSNQGKTYYVYNPEYDHQTTTAKESKKIGPGQSVTTVSYFTLPSDLKPGTYVRFASMIDDIHRQKGDNLDPDDDDLLWYTQVATGNMKAVGVTLVDENGKEVANPIPGNRYKIRYKMQYFGPNMKTKTNVTIHYQIKRKLPGGLEETITTQSNSNKREESVTKSLILKNGQTYSFDSKSYQWYEFPWIHTEAVLSSSVPGLNVNTSDDKFKKTWNQKYDFSIENLQVVPRTERDGVAYDGKQHFGVSFTINSEMPAEARKANYSKEVNIRININDQYHFITEHIIPGKNREITVDIPMKKPVPPGNFVHAKVEINYDGMAYESDHVGYKNNVAQTKVKSGTVYRDQWGVATNPTNTTDNTGAYVDGPVNPHRPLGSDNPSNSWYQRYHIHSWTGEKISYKAMGNRTFTFFRYTPKSNYHRSVYQWEDYQIKDVLFKSKETTENGWGNNGWVSLITDPGHAQVQAGYGYQIKMIVEYRTNAFNTEPVAYRNNNGSGQFVRPQNVLPNISRDVYFQTPDGKILSVSGTHETLPQFEARVVRATPDVVTIEYTLREGNTMGIQTPGRIYVAEDTPDGMYKVRAWTPTINGVPTKNKRVDSRDLIYYEPEPLLDIQGGPVSAVPLELPVKDYDEYGNPIIDTNRVPPMHFLVVGSHKDDLVDSVVQ